MSSPSSVLLCAAVVLVLALSGEAATTPEPTYTLSNGTYTTAQTSSCYKTDYSKWGIRSLAVGVSPSIFKLGKDGSHNACGLNLEVKCAEGKSCLRGNRLLKVKVVDECKTCDERTIRLTLSAYKRIALIDADDVVLGYRFL